MNKKPLISILTPVYNQASYIEETIHSVLNQTYENWEWIILNDGSTDNTEKIIKGCRDSRIKYAFQRHAGVDNLTKTFNNALVMCNGDLIAMLDGDDYWTDNKLEMQVKSFEDPDIVLSYGECYLINPRGAKIGYMSIPSDINIANNNPVGYSLKKLMLERHCFLPNSTVMLKRSTLIDIGGFVEAKGLFQDFPTWTRLSLEGRFSGIPVCLGFYRKHPSSISLISQGKKPELMFNAGIDFLREFVIQNKIKLDKLGLHYDIEELDKHWEELRRERFHYLPFNTALTMLKLGLFKEAKAEFSKFLKNSPSLKHKLIYCLIALSDLMRVDIVNPLASFKERLQRKISVKEKLPKVKTI